MFKIEDNIPLPTGVGRRAAPEGPSHALRQLAEAQVGASVFIPAKARQAPDVQKACLRATAMRVAGKGWYSIAAWEGGVRVWKRAEPTRAVT